MIEYNFFFLKNIFKVLYKTLDAYYALKIIARFLTMVNFEI